MNLNISFDQSIGSLPSGFVAAVNYVVNYFDNLFTNNVTVNIDLGYGEVDRQSLEAGALGENEANFGSVSYQPAISALEATGLSAGQVAAFSTLPASSPLSNGTLWLTTAQEKALGLLPSSSTAIDGWVGINNTVSFSYSAEATPASGQYYFIGVLEHEITEVMGRQSFLGEHIGATNSYGLMDLFRFSAPEIRQLTTHGPAYFSTNNGATNLDNWNTNPTGDLGDWAASAGADSFLAFSPSGQINSISSTDITLMNAIGWNTITLDFTAGQIQAEAFAITRTALAVDQATSMANSINSGVQTEAQFIDSLLSQVANTTIPAVAVEGSMYGAVGTSAEVTLLATQFLPGQVATAIANGFNPQVYASEALGLAFAFGNETGGMAFANSFGPSNVAMPNTTAGDLAFAAAASVAVFGSASTANLVNVLDGFVANWKSFYTSNGVPGLSHVSATQIDLAARGAAWGDAVGVALANNLGPLSGQTTNFLEDAAQGTATYSAGLASQPNHAPFQGSTVSADSNVQLTGISAHLDHAVI